MAETLLIGALDVSTVAHITGWDGLLEAGGPAGDLVSFDFTDGGEWQPGARPPYPFFVPVAMIGPTPGEITTQLGTLQALVGVEYTLTRTYLTKSATCQGVVTQVSPSWDRPGGTLMRAVLTITNLSGQWT
jgi:hypothetical protein